MPSGGGYETTDINDGGGSKQYFTATGELRILVNGNMEHHLQITLRQLINPGDVEELIGNVEEYLSDQSDECSLPEDCQFSLNLRLTDSDQRTILTASIEGNGDLMSLT